MLSLTGDRAIVDGRPPDQSRFSLVGPYSFVEPFLNEFPPVETDQFCAEVFKLVKNPNKRIPFLIIESKLFMKSITIIQSVLNYLIVIPL
jgi:hypothetical protein